MSRNRKAVAERKRREALLDMKNLYGNPDPTPREASQRIVLQEKIGKKG